MSYFTLYLKRDLSIEEVIRVYPELGTVFAKSLKECASKFIRGGELYYSTTGDVRDMNKVESFDKVLEDYTRWLLKSTEET